MKRDDLTGLGLGGNKARKLEFLCGQAMAGRADTLVTVGAAQSNHCRMTAAAGAVLGLDTHLVLGGRAPESREGNQLLSAMFGATLHFAGVTDWPALEEAKDALATHLREEGRRPATIPIGGSTAVGALGFLAAFAELADQASAVGVAPAAIVFATSSGGTHAGLLAGQALWRAAGLPVAEVIAVAVAPAVASFPGHAADLAVAALDLAGCGGPVGGDLADPVVVPDWIGAGYGVPTPEGDAAAAWAARHGAWVLDRTYTAKGFAGLLAMAGAGRFGSGDDVVFWHTGGHPAVFARGGWSGAD